MYHNHPQAERGSMTYPQSMAYYVKSLESLTTGTFKIPATTNGELIAHQQFSVLLPTAALIDTRGLRLNFQAKAVGHKGRLPNNMSALFSSIDVNIGGINVSSIQENGVLDQTLVNWGQKVKDPVTEKDSVSLKVSSVDLEDIANAEEYTYNNDKAYFSVPLGQFFETISPSVISTNYMPQIEIVFHLASNSVIASPSNDTTFANITAKHTAQSTYSIKNYHVICPVMSIANNDYDALLQQTLMSRGSLELVFRNWETFSDIFSATTRASSSASSLDMLVATFRRNTATAPLESAYTGINALIPVKGKNNQCLAGVDTGNQTSGLVGGALTNDNNNHSEFLVAPLCFTAPVPANSLSGATFQSDPEAKFQWKINGTPQPSFAASLSEWYTLSRDAWGVKKTKCTNLNEFFSNRFCAAVRLNLKESQNQRIVSGLDLRQSNSSLTFDLVQNNAYATSTDNVILMLANTSRLIVGEGKQINVVN
tara:strand:+ start:583 stop:2028 length:1446 start_codon:yes stop_codon:yes gene_type:complete